MSLNRHRRLITQVTQNGDILTLEDGYAYFWTVRGALSAADLRAIADELDRRNEAWDERVKRLSYEKY